MYTDKPLITKKLANSRIHYIKILTEPIKLIICSAEDRIYILHIKRTVKMKEIIAHTDAVINIESVMGTREEGLVSGHKE